MMATIKNIISNIIKKPLRIIRHKINFLKPESFENIDIGQCPFPSTAFFLLNNRCNAKCVMCSVKDYLNDKPAESITLDRFKIIAKNLHLERFKAVVLSGAGDPLLNVSFLNIISFINQCR